MHASSSNVADARIVLRFFTHHRFVASPAPPIVAVPRHDFRTRREEELMDWFAGEPTLEDTLSDPIVRAVMKRDDIELEAFRRFLDETGARLEAGASHDPSR
jgi:hypothetical protein